MIHKGYVGTCIWDATDRIFYGRIAGISDIVGYHADTREELEVVFREAVDDYMEPCRKIGKPPQRPSLTPAECPKSLARHILQSFAYALDGAGQAPIKAALVVAARVEARASETKIVLPAEPDDEEDRDVTEAGAMRGERARAIRLGRRALEVTQAELAELLGVEEKDVRGWEAALPLPSS
ncbi:hypothetical protein LCM28_09975 [Salipiger pacificus]|nr:hypothetical protein [Alloyangia pacifica]